MAPEVATAVSSASANLIRLPSFDGAMEPPDGLVSGRRFARRMRRRRVHDLCRVARSRGRRWCLVATSRRVPGCVSPDPKGCARGTSRGTREKAGRSLRTSHVTPVPDRTGAAVSVCSARLTAARTRVGWLPARASALLAQADDLIADRLERRGQLRGVAGEVVLALGLARVEARRSGI